MKLTGALKRGPQYILLLYPGSKQNTPVVDHSERIKKMNEEGVVEYAVDTAEEFWEMLSPQRYLFSPQNRPMFRGQGDTAWKLTPSILRGKNHPVHAAAIFRGRPEQSDSRIFTEIESLRVFAEYCDVAGLQLPSDSSSFRREYLDVLKTMDAFVLHRKLWPSEEYFELMALAQHHGLPTRLLDWSRRSYVAAYFAAADALENVSGRRFAVWALDAEQMTSTLPNLTMIRSSRREQCECRRAGGTVHVVETTVLERKELRWPGKCL